MKLLASDFDNTLFIDKDYNKNIKYINKFVDEGNVFAIITGRHINGLLKDIKGTNLKYSFLICNDGGIIFDKDLNVLYQKDVPSQVVNDIATLYEQSKCLDDWYIDTGLIITKDKTMNANGLIGRFNDRNLAAELLNHIKNHYEGIDGYLSDLWINISEKTVNKGAGIEKLITILNINKSDVYTIGDNINDLSMSNHDFNNFRMSNSIIELKSKTIRAYSSVYELIMDILKDGLK